MRFNRKALEALFVYCLIVAATTVMPSSGLWFHVAEATASVLILLSVFCFMRGGQRAR
jgi:hypothetical protein